MDGVPVMVWKATLPRTEPKPGHSHFVLAYKAEDGARVELTGQASLQDLTKAFQTLTRQQPEFCCALSWAAAKQLAWASVLATACSCDPHIETCTTCLPISFRKGGKWHAYKEPQA